jgi:hypothetical protein
LKVTTRAGDTGPLFVSPPPTATQKVADGHDTEERKALVATTMGRLHTDPL